MHGARSRRVAGFVVGCIVTLTLTACHGGGATASGSSGDSSGTRAVDVKGACAALQALERSGDALQGVNLADPDASSAALAHAVAAYSAALATFAQIGPAELRATAAVMRADVVAHHFTQAAAARAALSRWDDTHCAS